jgi:MFS family permease
MSGYAGMMLVARSFKKRRGLAAGIGATGAGVGTIFWATVIPGLVDQIQLAWTLRLLSLIVTCGNLVAATLLIDMNATIRKVTPGGQRSAKSKHRPSPPAVAIKNVFRGVKMRLVCVGVTIAAHGMLTPTIGVVSFAAQHVVDVSERTMLVSYLGFGALVLRIVFALLAVCSQ